MGSCPMFLSKLPRLQICVKGPTYCINTVAVEAVLAGKQEWINIWECWFTLHTDCCGEYASQR